MRLPRLFSSAALVGLAGLAHAASWENRVEPLFRPPLAEMMALSPDGQHVAYTTRDGANLAIVMMNIDDPGAKRTLRVDDDAGTGSAPDRPPVQLRFLRWAAAGRLVFAPTERVVPLPPLTDKDGRSFPNPDGPTIVSPILVVDTETRARGTLIDASNFQETPADARRTLADLLRTTKEIVTATDEPVRWRMPHLDILGFSARGRDQLIIQTRGAYSPPAQHAIDVRTGEVTMFDGRWPAPPGEPHIFDWDRLKVIGERKEAARPTTVWRDEDLGRAQRELEAKFPRRTVEILDWSETRARMLFRVTGGSDPGRVFVFQRPEDLVLEIFVRAPWLAAAKLHESRFFEFDAPDGARLSGYLTWPRQTRADPPPVLVCFPTGFPGHAQSAFDPEAQIFADWGFVVVQLNHRGVAGIRPQDLNSLRSAVDRISVGDALAAVDWIATRHPGRPFDRQRIAAMGRGFGGYLALRALQFHPAAFRCGIAIDAPMTLRPWLHSSAPAGATPAAREIPAALFPPDAVDWNSLSVSEQPWTLTRPAFLLHEPGRDPAIDASIGELRVKLQDLGRPPEHLELEAGFAAARPETRMVVYRTIEAFFNRHLLVPAAGAAATREGN